jgi:hypothetical protein
MQGVPDGYRFSERIDCAYAQSILSEKLSDHASCSQGQSILRQSWQLSICPINLRSRLTPLSANCLMKVIHHSSVRLTLRETLLGLRILSICSALTGFYIFIAFEFPVDWFGGFCIAIASFINVLSPTEICHFDKTRDRLSVHQVHWLKQRVKHYPISLIKGVQVESREFMGASLFQLRLYLINGESFPLCQSLTTDGLAQQTLAKQVNRFLDPQGSRQETAESIPAQ